VKSEKSFDDRETSRGDTTLLIVDDPHYSRVLSIGARQGLKAIVANAEARRWRWRATSTRRSRSTPPDVG
jgi:hypothetical protein